MSTNQIITRARRKGATWGHKCTAEETSDVTVLSRPITVMKQQRPEEKKVMRYRDRAGQVAPKKSAGSAVTMLEMEHRNKKTNPCEDRRRGGPPIRTETNRRHFAKKTHIAGHKTK